MKTPGLTEEQKYFIIPLAQMWMLSDEQQLKVQERGRRRAEVRGQRWEAAICSETHLSWIVSVSAAQRGDVGSVRVCECLDGVLERKTNK